MKNDQGNQRTLFETDQPVTCLGMTFPNEEERAKNRRISPTLHSIADNITSDFTPPLRKAGFSQNHIRCYVLMGFDKEEERYRLEELYKSGCLPFAQLYKKDDDSVEYTDDWKKFARVWCRPAIYKSLGGYFEKIRERIS